MCDEGISYEVYDMSKEGQPVIKRGRVGEDFGAEGFCVMCQDRTDIDEERLCKGCVLIHKQKWCSNCGMKDDGCINLGYGDWYCMNFLDNRKTYDGRYDKFKGEEEEDFEAESDKPVNKTLVSVLGIGVLGAIFAPKYVKSLFDKVKKR